MLGITGKEGDAGHARDLDRVTLGEDGRSGCYMWRCSRCLGASRVAGRLWRSRGGGTGLQQAAHKVRVVLDALLELAVRDLAIAVALQGEGE